LLSWTYATDDAGVAGDDRAYLDQLRLVGGPSTLADFESRTVASAGFETSYVPLSTDRTSAACGSRILRSGAIGHRRASTPTFCVTTARWSRIGFAIRVSTEPTNDPVNVTFDGVEVFRLSGEQPWSYCGYDVSPGSHTAGWRYIRDGAGGAGSTAVWIDDVHVETAGCDKEERRGTASRPVRTDSGRSRPPRAWSRCTDHARRGETPLSSDATRARPVEDRILDFAQALTSSSVSRTNSLLPARRLPLRGSSSRAVLHDVVVMTKGDGRGAPRSKEVPEQVSRSVVHSRAHSSSCVR
jgi:hypothetical protein